MTRVLLIAAAFGLLALSPLAAWLFDDPFLVTLFTRVVILALAAVALDLVLGYGGLVSLGHAAFLGIGAYTAGILASHAFDGSAFMTWPFEIGGSAQALVTWPLAMLTGGLLAAVLAPICLRTAGVHFIMITLAFAQMLYYFFISLPRYGGEDGLVLFARAEFPGLDLGDDVTFFYLCLILLGGYFLLARRLVAARLGMVLRGAKQNPGRMAALGFPLRRYQLAVYAISGAGTALAGALQAELDLFVSPTLLSWHQSGELVVIVLLGGMGTLIGPVFGAAALVLLEEVLGRFTEHWMFVLGPILVLVALFSRRGLLGWLEARLSR